MQYSLQTFFEMLGHKTIVADSPLSAISLSNTFNLDVLVSEYLSHDKNYLKLFELLKSEKSHIKIIILTSTNYTLDDLEPLFAIDIKSIFQKPIDPNIICYAVDEFAKKHRFLIPFH